MSHHHQIKSRIKEEKEDEYSNSLAKTQVCAMFRAGDIRRNVLLKFISLCMEAPCLCPSEQSLHENLFSCKDCSDCEISADKLLFLAYITAFSAVILISKA